MFLSMIGLVCTRLPWLVSAGADNLSQDHAQGMAKNR
uniref:Uncharacterized protein n=1 Tax=Yersinia aldovae TaxID=29483 RepID=A0ABM9SXI8_YERAL|nr:Uncharacterised protein [Yersinia aldovae]